MSVNLQLLLYKQLILSITVAGSGSCWLPRVCNVSDESFRDEFRSQTCCKAGEKVKDTAWWISGILAFYWKIVAVVVCYLFECYDMPSNCSRKPVLHIFWLMISKFTKKVDCDFSCCTYSKFYQLFCHANCDLRLIYLQVLFHSEKIVVTTTTTSA